MNIQRKLSETYIWLQHKSSFHVVPTNPLCPAISDEECNALLGDGGEELLRLIQEFLRHSLPAESSLHSGDTPERILDEVVP